MNIGYKKLQKGYIAKLEILGKTNENRIDIANPQYAKYRASKVKVLKIFHMNGEVNGEVNDETQVIKQMNGILDMNFVYTSGKEICVSNYDRNVNTVSSQGIHYFKTPYQAKMWQLSSNNYTGKYMDWYDNGNKRREGEYKNGKQEGKWIEWYEDGNKKSEEEFKNGEREGKRIMWYTNGNEWYEEEYKDGKLEGKYIEWYEDGTKKEEGEYKNGKQEGKWVGWLDNNNKIHEREYKDGKEEGKW